MSRQEILDEPASALPHAAQFLAGYFHQDWVVDRGGWEEVVDDFIADSPGSVVVDAAAELRGLLDAALTGEELARVLDDVGCSVDPSAYALSAAGWLVAVLARLDDAR